MDFNKFDPDRIDPAKFVDSRTQLPWWWRYRTVLFVASMVYWLISAAFLAWLKFGVDPDKQLPLWMGGIALLSLIGLLLVLTMVLGRLVEWLSPSDFEP